MTLNLFIPRRKSASSLSECVGVGGPLVPPAGSPSGGVGTELWHPPSDKCEELRPMEFMFFGSVATFDAGTAICCEESNVCNACRTS